MNTRHCTNRMRFILDPRTKLALLLFANLTLFLRVSIAVEALMVALLLATMFVAGRRVAAAHWLACYVALLALAGVAAAMADTYEWVHLVGLASSGIRMMMPSLIAGAFAFTTTSASEFVCAMRRLHVPEDFVIPCIVVIRFFPTIRHDYRQIRHAMALRGIANGAGGLLRRPMQSLEYVLVPLMMNATNVAQDLSMAALTKGLGLPGEHTCRARLRVRPADWLIMLCCALPPLTHVTGLL